ncbi:MAG TPA: acylphosphatase [Halomonas sp.]|nr:acylphosphatase [Halomonas sp.]
MKHYCVRALVSGRVQGVWYRGSTQERAQSAGVTGHAVNLPDGRVEVLMCGDPARVSQLAEWLWQGPERARVTDVELEEVELETIGIPVPERFTIG